MQNKNKLVIYKSKSGKIEVDVRIEKETIWLSQKQIANLFNIDRSVIAKHLKNIFNSDELCKKSNVQKMHIADSDKPVQFYNLDAIISVGYRVNSKQATQFRIWATDTLKNYLIDGCVIDQKRLIKQVEKFKQLQRTDSVDQLLYEITRSFSSI